MGNVCEHEFNNPDPNNSSYSFLEYDLYAKLDLSIWKNFITGNYELFRISDGVPVFSYPKIEDAVDKANELEGAENTKVFCGVLCPERWC